jgi:hypothetical protein
MNAFLKEKFVKRKNKYQKCSLCAGTGQQGKCVVFEISTTCVYVAPVSNSNDVSECSRCSGYGRVALPPFGDGSKSKITQEKISELASAATILRCMGSPLFIQGIANQAASVSLPKDVVNAYKKYWENPCRDVTLGEYIRQVAQFAEELALATYGSLDNGCFAIPRPDLPLLQLQQ